MVREQQSHTHMPPHILAQIVRKRGGPKYSKPITSTTPWLPRDRNALVRLVHKFGKKAVIAAADQVSPKRGRGRPSRGDLPVLELIFLAQWFEEEEERQLQRGSKTPIKDAEHALYDLIFDPEQQRETGHFDRWQKQIKKKRLQGRRLLPSANRITAKFWKRFFKQRGRK
jgi:hypothetical protein